MDSHDRETSGGVRGGGVQGRPGPPDVQGGHEELDPLPRLTAGVLLPLDRAGWGGHPRTGPGEEGPAEPVGSS